jgi:hypothetical protein
VSFVVAADYDWRIVFQLLAKSLTAKSWGEEPQPEGVANARKAAEGGKSYCICMAESKSTLGAHRDAATAPQKMILPSMILSKSLALA